MSSGRGLLRLHTVIPMSLPDLVQPSQVLIGDTECRASEPRHPSPPRARPAARSWPNWVPASRQCSLFHSIWNAVRHGIRSSMSETLDTNAASVSCAVEKHPPPPGCRIHPLPRPDIAQAVPHEHLLRLAHHHPAHLMHTIRQPQRRVEERGRVELRRLAPQVQTGAAFPRASLPASGCGCRRNCAAGRSRCGCTARCLRRWFRGRCGSWTAPIGSRKCGEPHQTARATAIIHDRGAAGIAQQRRLSPSAAISGSCQAAASALQSCHHQSQLASAPRAIWRAKWTSLCRPRPRSLFPQVASPSDRPQDPSLYFNRELSWLEFNRRVLDEAQDLRHPLLERLKFLAIFSSNLDEFFMIRVSGLKDQIAAGVTTAPADGMTPAEQLAEIRARTLPMLQRAAALLPRRDHAGAGRRGHPHRALRTTQRGGAGSAARLLRGRDRACADAAGVRSRAGLSRTSPT